MQIKPLKDYSIREKIQIILFALFVIFAWSTPFTATSIGLRSFTPNSVAFLRIFFASILSIILGFVYRLPLPGRKDIPELAGFGLIYFVLYNLTLNYAQQLIPVSITSIFFAFAPAIVLILAAIILHERVPAYSIFGLYIAICGVMSIILRNGLGKVSFGMEYVWLVGSILSFAFGTIIQKHLVRRFTSIQVMVYSLPLSALMMVWVLPSAIREIRTASTVSIFAILYLGCVPGLIGLIVWGEILKKIPAGEAEVFICADTPGSVLIAWIILGEKPSAIVWLGLTVILVGMFMVTRGQKRAKNHK